MLWSMDHHTLTFLKLALSVWLEFSWVASNKTAGNENWRPWTEAKCLYKTRFEHCGVSEGRRRSLADMQRNKRNQTVWKTEIFPQVKKRWRKEKTKRKNKKMERPIYKGLEPLTLRLKVWCSTNWANRALTPASRDNSFWVRKCTACFQLLFVVCFYWETITGNIITGCPKYFRSELFFQDKFATFIKINSSRSKAMEKKKIYSNDSIDEIRTSLSSNAIFSIHCHWFCLRVNILTGPHDLVIVDNRQETKQRKRNHFSARAQSGNRCVG